MAMIEVIKDPTRTQLRQFGGIFLPVFVVIVGFLVQRAHGSWVVPGALFGLALTSILATLARPGLLRPLFVALQYGTFPIGWLVSHVMFALVYFGLVAPIGLLVRTLRGDALERHFDRSATSYWKPRQRAAGVERYFRQY